MPHRLNFARVDDVHQLVYGHSNNGQIHPLQGYQFEDLAALSPGGAASKLKTNTSDIVHHPFKLQGPCAVDLMNEHGVSYIGSRNTAKLPPDVAFQHLPHSHQDHERVRQGNGFVTVGDEIHRHGDPFHTLPIHPHRPLLHPFNQNDPEHLQTTRTFSKPRHANSFNTGAVFEF